MFNCYLRLLTFLFIFFPLLIFSQDINQGYAFRKAEEKGSRTMNGKPGNQYWQNSADYDIYLKVTPSEKNVEAYETIVYTNNSPDTLYSLRFKFYLNTHAPSTERHYPVKDEYFKGGIIVDKFFINDKNIKWKEEVNTTDYIKTLPIPLYPHQNVKLNFSWHYTLSWEHLREGMLDSTSCFLAYFYPRVAVYDDYRKWDDVDFTEDREFYNDFNNYKLTIQAPKNYLVWSTGELQNVDEVLSAKYAQRFKTAATSDEYMSIVNSQERAADLITLDRDWLLWKFNADNISDMACAISNTYLWDASSVLLKNNTKRTLIQSAYNDASADFKEMTKYTKEGIQWFSENLPGVNYPFPSMTVVKGFADMEYPMMVNNNSQSAPIRSRWVAEHEIAHSWFPFYMGINEAVYPCMDEGWAVFMEYFRNRATLGETDGDRFFIQSRSWRWSKGLDIDELVPIITPAYTLVGRTQSGNAYVKPALAYMALYHYLGEKEFLRCLQLYMQDWHNKHPSPWDMFNSFITNANKKTAWLWNNWFYENTYVDLSLHQVNKSGKKVKINIINKGKAAIPFEIVIYSLDNKVIRKSFDPGVWEQDQNELDIKISCPFKPAAVELHTGVFVDKFEQDNLFEF